MTDFGNLRPAGCTSSIPRHDDGLLSSLARARISLRSCVVSALAFSLRATGIASTRSARTVDEPATLGVAAVAGAALINPAVNAAIVNATNISASFFMQILCLAVSHQRVSTGGSSSATFLALCCPWDLRCLAEPTDSVTTQTVEIPQRSSRRTDYPQVDPVDKWRETRAKTDIPLHFMASVTFGHYRW